MESSRVIDTGPAQSFFGMTNAAQLRASLQGLTHPQPRIYLGCLAQPWTKFLRECDMAEPQGSPAMRTETSTTQSTFEMIGTDTIQGFSEMICTDIAIF